MSNVKKPWYKRWRVWVVVFVGMMIFGSIYNMTPAGKQAAEEARQAEVVKAEAAEQRKIEREEKAAARADKADAEYEKAKIAADKYEKEQAVAKKKEKESADQRDVDIPIALDDIIANADGTIVSIDKQPGRDDWGVMRVVVTDDWYRSQEFEKERYAEVIGGAVQGAVGDADGPVLVNFYDAYGKELATQRVLGGWKIKR